MTLDVLLAPDVVVECCLSDSKAALLRQWLSSVAPSAFRIWLYAGSVDRIFSDLVDRIGKNQQIQSVGPQLEAASRLRNFVDGINWLAALAEDGIWSESEHPALAQLCKAVKRLGADAWLVTDDPHLGRVCPQSISFDEIGRRLDEQVSHIEFIDLQTQQDRIRPQLERRLHEVLRHGRYIMGPEVAELEEKLADFVGAKHCISVASGTDSLLIAMMALGVESGDEVITVPYTWISTAEMIALLGAKPVFIDIDPRTFNMDVQQLEGAITSKTKAIMPVSIYGQCADMAPINAIAQRHGIPVIEDAAQSFGATYEGRRSCSLSEIGSTSFFPSKPLGCYGDGGALFTDDDRLATLMAQIRIHGQSRKHYHPLIGINGRLDTMQAAVLLSKIDHFDEECQARSRIGKRYNELFELAESSQSQLQNHPGIICPLIDRRCESVFAQYTIRIEQRDEVQASLSRCGIPSVAYYVAPLHLQPAFHFLGHKVGDFPVSEEVARTCLSLPMNPYLDDETLQKTVSEVSEAVSQITRTVPG